MPRKTKAEYDQEHSEKKSRVWAEFHPKLENLNSLAEARSLANQSPPTDSPGRIYYSNLAFFLGSFIMPAESNYTERLLYLQLIQKMDSAGELKAGIRQKVEEEFQRSMNSNF